jgi:hypothetical protein
MRRWNRWTVATVLALLLAGGAASGLPARAATTLVVNTTADLAAPCQSAAFSLRCALIQANTDGAGDTITFHIPAGTPGCAGTPAVCTIRPRSALPALTASSTVINGYSQPGASPNTQALSAGDNAVITVHLDGSRAGVGVDGLVLLGAGDSVQGLSITGFQTCFSCTGTPGAQTGGSAVRINGPRDSVAGNFLGVAPDGLTGAGNQFAGVLIGPRQIAAPSAAGGDIIGGNTPAASNVLSGNSDCTGGDCKGFGVYVNGGSGSVIARNYIGTTVSGTEALSNSATGVVILTPNNILGSTTAGAGNVISGNGGDGVLIGGSGAVVVGNKIGTNAAGSAGLGTAGLGNGSHGLDIQAPGARVAGNMISANGDTGLVLETSGNVVQGNLIGTDITGATGLGNGFHPTAIFLGQPINGTDGLVVCAGPNTIGGTAPGTGNVVSANAGDGISLVSSGNVVQGNRVGTNAAGTAALANGVDGIGSQAFPLQGVGFCQQAPNSGGSNNTIGGSMPGAGNLIGGNAGDGVDLVAGTGNTIAGNRIGTTAAGTGALGNGGMGVFLGAVCDDGVCQPSSNDTIGGTGTGVGNIIGANGADAIHIDGTGGGVGNVVQGNRIGTDTTGQIALGNLGNGIFVGNGAVNDSVGGTAAGASNTIARNGGAGVLVGASASDTGTHISVNQNAIFANGGLGIDLAPQGMVNCTAGSGPNDYTPCPIIQRATTARVSGTACPGCGVEVFIAVAGEGDQGHGEGKTFLGRATADAGGAWSLSLSGGQVGSGQQLTATATTPVAFATAAETSEFAANVTVS